MSKVRTRMAPSPTGEYHIGHLRTLLYNCAFAQKNKGSFVLRIEDTDQERKVPGAVKEILSVITDFGFSWDEGPGVGGPFGPYVQSERLDIYKKYVDKLIESKSAYYCFCTSDRLKDLRDKQRSKKIPTKYDKKCLSLTESEVKRRISAGEPHVVRLNVVPNETIIVNDVVYGEISVNSSEIDDQILLKSDGFPTYHLAVVVDDHLMNITHILRGNDWIPSTPKHVLLYKAFGWELPIYVHLPNLKEKDGSKKLSKRFGSVSAREFLQEGYLPEALLNFLMFLGWNPGTEKEIYSFDEFVNDFSLDKIHKTDLVSFDRDKLLWFNSRYIKSIPTKDLAKIISMWAERYNISLGFTFDGDKRYSSKTLLYILDLVKERMQTLSDFTDLVKYFFVEPSVDLALLTKYAKSREKTAEILTVFKAEFEKIKETSWDVSTLDRIGHEVLKNEGYKPKEAFMTVRVAVSGRSATPPLFEMLYALGKETTLKRLKNSLLRLDITH